MRNPRQISVYLYWSKGMRCPRVLSLCAALRVTAGDRIPCRAWRSGPSISSLSRYYMNPGGCEGVPTSTLIMPFLNMFKSRRGRSTSLPRAQDRYLHDEVYNQPSAYGPRSNSGFNRSAHPTLHHTGSRAQRNPSYGPSYSNSGPERYAESSISSNDQVRTTLSVSPILQCHELVFSPQKKTHV